MFIKLAIKSLLYRKTSVLFTLLAMSMSVFIMVGVEHIRLQAKTSFTNSISGVDLIVGARTSNINLLLYSVFRVGEPTNNVSLSSYQALLDDTNIRWAVPIALGDSHKGFRVMGTTNQYFEYFSFANKQYLSLKKGTEFKELFDVVIGSQVANKLGYVVGDKVVLSHGIGVTSFTHHDHLPFRVSGILSATGTPVDQTVHVSLQGLHAVHLPKAKIKSVLDRKGSSLTMLDDFIPQSITSVFLGLKSRIAVFQIQRKINSNPNEPLSAILPGVALSQLWQTMSIFDNVLRLISLLVFISSLLGLTAMLCSSIKERSHEIKLLRMIGAPAGFIFWFIELEALLIAFLGSLVACSALSFMLLYGQSYLIDHYGVVISANILQSMSLVVSGLFVLLVFSAALAPALIAYKEAKT
ncbi:ABC transporter permease [Thalassotalea eurytherma]|uniref:Permease n=1 Tax=Thalassotalea eurytherma TaxID=1144278 RepID=A0ABQ6H2J3_9GAMM|nr:ABC transporter permease [Thalassotalea eurytherma]GLX82398.1 permease [Thalassotalea eurytherma]